MMRELIETRREMAGQAFVHYRESFGGHNTFLRLKVLVPICPECWISELRMPYKVPPVSPNGWDIDLLLLGFHPRVVDKLKEDIDEGVGPERGPWCFVCHEWIPWWKNDEGCYIKEVDFAEYFGFQEKEEPSISKATKKRIVRMYGSRCFSCGRTLSKEEITIDHIVACLNGGTGDQVNLQILCSKCNSTKGNAVATERESVLHFPMRPVPSDAYEGVTW